MSGNDRTYIIGIDIGGTNIRIGMVTEDGQLHDSVIGSSHILNHSSLSVQKLQNYIKEYINQYGKGKLLAISIGLPSTISKDKKVVYSSPNMIGFNNINLVDPLEMFLQVPVFIDNDVNHLLMYEIAKRKLENSGIVLGFYVGTGLGNSIYIHNSFLEGKHGVAAELGHIPMLGKTDVCNCGNVGCVELYASGKGLETLNKTYFPDTPIEQIFVKHKDEAVIQEFIEAISIPIATEINIFDPDYIIIGGGVIHMEAFPREVLEQKIVLHSRKPFPAEGLSILYTENNQQAGVIGAAFHAYNRIRMRSYKVN
jgi:allose kinase